MSESTNFNVMEHCTMPFGRYRVDSKGSGEGFRDDKLTGWLKDYDEITLDLTKHPLGYPSSWLEECFGGLIRNNILTKEEFYRRITIIVDSKTNDEIIAYVEEVSEK